MRFTLLLVIALAGCIGSGESPQDAASTESPDAGAGAGTTAPGSAANGTLPLRSIDYADCVFARAQVPVDQPTIEELLPEGWTAGSWLAEGDERVSNLIAIVLDCQQTRLGAQELGRTASFWVAPVVDIPGDEDPVFPVYVLASVHSHDAIAALWGAASPASVQGEVAASFEEASFAAVLEATATGPGIDWTLAITGSYALGGGDATSHLFHGAAGESVAKVVVDRLPGTLGAATFVQSEGPIPFIQEAPVVATEGFAFSYGDSQAISVSF